jgi:hypothetical protein
VTTSWKCWSAQIQVWFRIEQVVLFRDCTKHVVYEHVSSLFAVKRKDKQLVGYREGERTAQPGKSIRGDSKPPARVVGISSNKAGRVVAKEIDCNLILSGSPPHHIT